MLDTQIVGSRARCSAWENRYMLGVRHSGSMLGRQMPRGMLEPGTQGRIVDTNVHAGSQILVLRSIRSLGLSKTRMSSGLALLAPAPGMLSDAFPLKIICVFHLT